ncbi:hypothetical protein SAMN02746041_02223 [Desulfacinum hydrothermale DSM 13146]|uniref:Uncharacterized protein n=1 Tax=Desulfacinum hydrothermale DSM 13146 TaxID=1121390 RepID=A0A1W1XMR9_9BACT|nr:hypothetical protein [Desulfacinum hydrothermale]SMC25154.1 hypothetical protein SAMN02746041_02223 [Desulfacinum hydrothermale DSM 13146]
MTLDQLLEKIDALEGRCPKLGHQVAFGYCRRETGTLPCPRTLACWQHRFNAELILRHLLTPEQWDAVFSTAPKTRVDSLLEAIEAAKTRREPSAQ